MQKCRQLVEARAGLDFPRERWMDLQRALSTVASELGFADAEECARQLISKQASPEQVEVLISRLTIGETYFFRDKNAFTALETSVLPELIRARRSSGKRLRIWSAGCCTGEEAYSIAITVGRVLPDLANWDVTILGTDINPHFLQKAAVGIYRPWSFRNTPEELKARYFRGSPEDNFQIIPQLRKLVTFRCVNLTEDIPSLLNRTNAMDVIFCRNVLMYFSHEQAKKVTANLYPLLAEDGWLFPSGTETSQELFGQFVPVDVAGTILYRKSAPAADSGNSRPPAPAVSAPEHQDCLQRAPIVGGDVPTPVEAPSRAGLQDPAAAHAARARMLANEGRLEDALAACDQALEADKLAPSHHYLRGLILQEEGAFDEAAAALRRALFLDDRFVLAHFALGNLLRRSGRTRDAARSFENVRGLLSSGDPTAVLPESDGLTVGRLLAMLEALESSA